MRLAACRKSRSWRAAVSAAAWPTAVSSILMAVALSGCASHAGRANQPVSLADGRVTVAVPAGSARVSGRGSPARQADHPWLRQLAASEKVMVTGRLAKAGLTVTFHLRPRGLPAGAVPFLARQDPQTGRWIPLPSHYRRRAGTVAARITGPAVVAPLAWYINGLTALVKGAVLGMFGFGGTGSYPECSSYDITVTDSHPASHPAIGTCAQSSGPGRAEIKLADLRPYPLDITYPYTRPGPDGAPGSSATTTSSGLLVTLWTLGTPHGHVLVPGFGSTDITISLAAGATAQITSSLDRPAFNAAMLDVGLHLADTLGAAPEFVVKALDAADCARDYFRVSSAGTLTEPVAEDAGDTALKCVSAALTGTAAIVAAGVTIAASLVVAVISTAWALIDTALGQATHTLTVHNPATTCPSAAAVRQVMLSQPEWNSASFTVSPQVKCLGPYVGALAYASPGDGASIILEQEPQGLTYLVAGSGPICTSNPAEVEPGQVIYIPPKYSQAFPCLKV